MDNILSSLFNITLFPFTSGSYFVSIPCMFCFITACFGLVSRLIKGDYRGLIS